MRTDEGLWDEFRNNRGWKIGASELPATTVDPTDADVRARVKHLSKSFSGHERNHLFMSREGREFRDVSGISGLDMIADSRGFALVDYNRDGWLDVALVNANAPLLMLFRNEMHRIADAPVGGHFLAFRFVGGNDSASESEWTARDGYGVKVRVASGDQRWMRELRCGEGFASQNSSTLFVGMGDRTRADRITVEWPSGRVQSVDNVSAGQLITVYEVASQSPRGTEFDITQYAAGDSARTAAVSSSPPEPKQLEVAESHPPPSSGSAWRMYVSMATWCVACRTQMPHVQFLRQAFSDEELAIYGVPIDVDETSEQLLAYAQETQPPYLLLADLESRGRRSFQGHLQRTLQNEAVPSTVITDHTGTVLSAFVGIPTVSQLLRLRDEHGGR